jgi:hypothetical protein
MARFLTAVLAALLLPVPAGATLVVLVPSADGLVVAADTRISILGAQCDGQFKIAELAKPARIVVMVTGDSLFIQPPGPHETDLCRYVASAPRMLDISAIVRSYLERDNSTPDKISLEDLGKVCVQAVQRFQQSNPAAFRSYAGRDIFSVIVASYDPASRVSTMRNFIVRIDARTGEIQAARFAQIAVSPQDRRGVWSYGEADYLEKQVYAGIGRLHLAASTQDFILVNKPVAEAPLDQAVAAAVNVIQAASLTTRVGPSPSGIGGPIDVILLGRKPRPEPIQWAAQ